MTDPHLIIYAPVRALPGGEYTIVTNGDQTDTVYDFMQNGQTFEDALRTRTFEDDRPNWTPRISGLVRVADGRQRPYPQRRRAWPCRYILFRSAVRTGCTGQAAVFVRRMSRI